MDKKEVEKRVLAYIKRMNSDGINLVIDPAAQNKFSLDEIGIFRIRRTTSFSFENYMEIYRAGLIKGRFIDVLTYAIQLGGFGELDENGDYSWRDGYIEKAEIKSLSPNSGLEYLLEQNKI